MKKKLKGFFRCMFQEEQCGKKHIDIYGLNFITNLLTNLQLYLNDGFERGYTNFLGPHKVEELQNYDGEISEEGYPIILKVKPAPGIVTSILGSEIPQE